MDVCRCIIFETLCYLLLLYSFLFLSLSPTETFWNQTWAVRRSQHPCLFIPLCSWRTIPCFIPPTGCICPPTTCPAYIVSVPCMPSTCTSGLWATHRSLCPAVPSPSCLAWWTPASLYPQSLCSPISSSPPSRNPPGLVLEHPAKANLVLTLPTWQRPPRRTTP